MAKERKSVIANTNASKTREQKSPKANTKVKPKAKRTNKPKHVCEFIDPNGAACSQEFGRQGNLKRHIREKHTGYVYSCGKAACNFWSANQSRVSDHKSSGHKLRTGQLDPDTKATLKPCDECSNHFRSEHFYNRHIEMGECHTQKSNASNNEAADEFLMPVENHTDPFETPMQYYPVEDALYPWFKTSALSPSISSPSGKDNCLAVDTPCDERSPENMAQKNSLNDLKKKRVQTKAEKKFFDLESAEATQAQLMPLPINTNGYIRPTRLRRSNTIGTPKTGAVYGVPVPLDYLAPFKQFINTLLERRVVTLNNGPK